jgi:hypothetical protein
MTILQYPGPPWQKYEGPTGEAIVCPDQTNFRPAKTITVVLYGRLRTGRDERFNRRTARQNHAAWVKEYTKWYERLTVLGINQVIRDSVEAWGVMGFKAHIDLVAQRKTPIQDFKNLVVGFDQGIIDGLVHGGLLLDDSTNHLQLSFNQEQGSPEYVWLRFTRGGTCPDHVRIQAEKRLMQSLTPKDRDLLQKVRNEGLYQ